MTKWLPVRILAAIGATAFSIQIVHAALTGDFMAEGAVLAGLAWGRVTLVDLYLGFVLTAGLIAWLERGLAARLFWILPLFILGNAWALAWVAVRLDAVLASRRDDPAI